MTDVRIIKRYSNRKLYDLRESRYVTLQEVAGFLQAGDEVQIIDNKNQEDITSVTLAQILYEQEKQKQSTLPLATLKGIIRSSGELLHRRLASPVFAIRDEAERRFGKVGEEARTMVAEVGHATQSALDEFTRAVDDRFQQLIGFPRISSTPPEEPEPTIIERLVALEKRLAALDARLKAVEKESKSEN